jgi:hypothetical protein
MTVTVTVTVPCVAFYAFYAFYAWWDYFPQSGALAEGTACSEKVLKAQQIGRRTLHVTCTREACHTLAVAV